MKKKLLVSIFIFLSIGFAMGQDISNSSRGTIISNEAPSNKISVDKTIVQNLYGSLEHKALTTGNAESLIFSDLDIQKYIHLFEANPTSFKEVDRTVAVQRIEAEVDNAAAKLKAINHSKNITLIDSDAFYGDESKLTKVISCKIDIVDKNDKPLLYEVIFIEVNGVYKVMAIN